MLSKIRAYYEEIEKDPNHRFKSWEHCYKYFKENRYSSSKDIDVFVLHLFTYLSSWGMLRGSLFSLQKDYNFTKTLLRFCYHQSTIHFKT